MEPDAIARGRRVRRSPPPRGWCGARGLSPAPASDSTISLNSPYLWLPAAKQQQEVCPGAGNLYKNC